VCSRRRRQSHQVIRTAHSRKAAPMHSVTSVAVETEITRASRFFSSFPLFLLSIFPSPRAVARHRKRPTDRPTVRDVAGAADSRVSHVFTEVSTRTRGDRDTAGSHPPRRRIDVFSGNVFRSRLNDIDTRRTQACETPDRNASRDCTFY